VSENVVDLLEPIQVDHQYGEASRRTVAHEVLCVVEKLCAIGEAGQ
jgi:hypothetical protein